jgi:hypothetical protein
MLFHSHLRCTSWYQGVHRINVFACRHDSFYRSLLLEGRSGNVNFELLYSEVVFLGSAECIAAGRIVSYTEYSKGLLMILPRVLAMDVSADLHELTRCPVGLVSAGVKSILDIRRYEFAIISVVCR